MEKRKIYLIIGICSILILALGLTTAWFTWSSQTNTDVTFTVSGLNITSTNTNITGELYPTLDKNNGIVEEFTVVQNNTMSTPVCGDFTLTLTTFPTELKHESFKYKLYNGNTLVGSGNFASSNQGDVITIATGQAITTTVSTYKLYIWIDGTIDNPLSMGSKTFLFNLGITANQQANACEPSVILCDADEVTPNAPALADGMIPVSHNGTTWVKADTSNTNNSWYNYPNKEWANAVMVSSGTRSNYMNASVGTEVLESDILAYYVWIPRYKYQLFNVEVTSIDPIEICMEFENGTPTKSNGTANDEWLTHPAFTFGTDELTGIWVGKFETTGSATTPTIKPNIVSLRNQNIAAQFTTSQKFGTSDYLTTTGVSEVDAHMMKNIEWGAVAYLKQSKYGLGLTDIALNSYSSYKTGCGPQSAGSTSSGFTCNAYNTDLGKSASTTGNITGIYDMSGGAYEYVMGVMQDNTGTNTPMSGYSSSYNSGFTGKLYDSGSYTDYTGTAFPNPKYYDLYTFGTSGSDYTRRILGDATGEVRGWYSDSSNFVYSSNPWFERGGNYTYGSSAGVFGFDYGDGDANGIGSFRVVLVHGA